MKKEKTITCKYCGNVHTVNGNSYECSKVFGGTVYINKKTKKEYPKRKPRTPRRWTAPWHMPVVPTQIFTEDVQVRQLEYLDAISELSCSTEGNELESLSKVTHEQFKRHIYQEDLGEFEEMDSDFTK